MKKINYLLSTGILVFLFVVSFSCGGNKNSQTDNIVGAWKGKVQFKSGAFAEVKDLEFMYVFNAGGTMTESSNYDGAPPVPPAYGIWKKTGENQYEAKYEFYTANPPSSFEDIKSSGGFSPAGYGVIVEEITLSDDGNSYSSVVTMALFDKAGNHTGVSVAEAKVVRMEF
jgi:hypothetical protein